jgi:hypothetical protein
MFPFLSDWHPAYQSCQRYFVNQAQHSPLVQAVAAFVNIRLPFQWADRPLSHLPTDKDPSGPPSPAAGPEATLGAEAAPGAAAGPPPPAGAPRQGPPFLSLIPYIRRLVVTGNDTDVILACFFGQDWARGVGPTARMERRNYMFVAKSAGWSNVKLHYDGGGGRGGGAGGAGGDEALPYMTPLANVQLGEIKGSERAWSDWLAMEDWMLGPRMPVDLRHPVSGDDGHDEMVQDHP